MCHKELREQKKNKNRHQAKILSIQSRWVCFENDNYHKLLFFPFVFILRSFNLIVFNSSAWTNDG